MDITPDEIEDRVARWREIADELRQTAASWRGSDLYGDLLAIRWEAQAQQIERVLADFEDLVR